MGSCRTGPGLWTSAPLLVLVLVLMGLVGPVGSVSEPGIWTLNVDSEILKKQNFFFFTKTLFNNSFIHLKLMPETCNLSSPVQLNVSWYLRNSHCYNEVFSLDTEHAGNYFKSTEVKRGGGNGYYVFHQYPAFTCKPHTSPTFGLEKFEKKTRLTEEPQKQVLSSIHDNSKHCSQSQSQRRHQAGGRGAMWTLHNQRTFQYGDINLFYPTDPEPGFS